jgi:ParB-like chromosome segregation protein Spo0J
MAKSGKKKLDHIAEPLRGLAIDIKLLNADPDNTVTHDSKSIAAIQRSLKRFGQDQPLVVQEEGMIVRKGNGRLAAAMELGWTHVAAVVVSEGNLAAVARSIADNRSGEFRNWDYTKLVDLLRELKEGGQDTEAVGWNASQLESLIQQHGDTPDLVPSGAAVDSAGEQPGGIPAALDEASQIRMVHLFFNVESFAEFTTMTEELQSKYETTNQTDTVLEAVRREANGQGDTAD